MFLFVRLPAMTTHSVAAASIRAPGVRVCVCVPGPTCHKHCTSLPVYAPRPVSVDPCVTNCVCLRLNISQAL